MTYALADSPTEIGSRRWLALALLCLVQFMVILDNTIVNVALPSIEEGLGFSAAGLQWVVSGYALTFGGLLILAGRASDLYGRRTFFMAGLGFFALASLTCGLADSPTMLIVARLVQGAGAAVVAPALLSLLTTTFQESGQRNLALGLWGAASAAGGAAGLLIGGVLTQLLSWHWIFFVNVPIGVVGLLLTPALLSESRDTSAARRLDLVGATILTAALGLLIFGLTRSETAGILASVTLLTLGLALLLLLAFYLFEGRTREPLVPFTIFRSRTLTGANLIVLMLFVANGALAFFATLYMQQVLGYSPVAVGFAFLPVPLLAIAISTLGGSRLVERFGTRRLMGAGMISLVVSMLLLSRISADGTYVLDILPGFVFFGVALGLAFFTSAISATEDVSEDQQGLASGLINTSQQLGVAVGLGVLAPLAAARTEALLNGAPGKGDASAVVAGYGLAYLIAVLLAIIGVLVAVFFIRKEKSEKEHK